MNAIILWDKRNFRFSAGIVGVIIIVCAMYCGRQGQYKPNDPISPFSVIHMNTFTSMPQEKRINNNNRTSNILLETNISYESTQHSHRTIKWGYLCNYTVVHHSKRQFYATCRLKLVNKIGLMSSVCSPLKLEDKTNVFCTSNFNLYS